ncbi:MAG: sodium:alanine symporter family protein [Bacteroidales bacterium]|nr:sodium:alanine symporter family protein [Bacteroidales bacterium]MCL2133806.1 sodium:alanine symporter family protein [Bacteroidales bacterium]
MEILSKLLGEANDLLWGWFMIILLLFTHFFLTIRTGFIQRYLGKAIKLTFKKSDKNTPGDVSHFSSLMIALSATIGVGNIVGVATAIGLGGPGAVFWCWFTGILGIATKYGEAVLALKYRVVKKNGSYAGGPMYALEKGVKSKFLAVAFSLLTVFASFGIGNMAQSNSLADAVNHSLNIPFWAIGGVTALLVGAVILGGVKSIAAVCNKLIPFMVIMYVLGCLTVLGYNFDFILPALSLIIKSAFSAKAIGGGLLGGTIIMAMRYGIARGLFSNESGMGSAPIAAAVAKTKVPAEQGLVSMSGTFWDTVVVCALTGITIVSGILKSPEGYAGLEGVKITYKTFSIIPFGEYFLMISLVFVTFSTLLGWSYYGEKALEYLSGGKGIMLYRIMWIIVAYIGATTSLKVVWDFSDFANALMVIPNVICLIALHKIIKQETVGYLGSKL